ncbi:MAG: putative Ig domain-containing protein, partial [Verrucomicrobia bacterium]|nr:putative Ig domain-containing protein [Verrucomicrobiota bacterium]
MKSTKLLALVAAGAFSLGTVQLSSAAFSNGDLLLSFQATGGEGVTSTIVANLGTGYSYRNATSNISNVINIGANLSSVFGNDWYDRTDLYFNIIGNKAAGYSPANQGGPVVDGDARNAIYVSRARTTSDGTSYTAWSGVASAMGTVGTQAQTYNTLVSSRLSSANVATIQTSENNTIEEFTTPAGSLLLNFSNFAADFNQAFASGSLFNVSGTDYEGSLTLQRINRVDGTTGALAGNYVEPGIAAGTGSNEGFFAIRSTGQVDYFAPVASVSAPVISSATSQNGLSVNATTGLILGTPTTAGNSTATINATNSGGTGNATLTISILPAAPAIASATSASGQVGTAFSYQIAASNNPASFGASGLPAGLSVNATTGLILGTPTTAGNSTATINASNSGGTGNATLTISILAAPPAITSATSASVQVGTTFSYQIAASNNPASFGASGLPAGLSVNATTGLISGTPTTTGSANITLIATNSSGAGNATLILSITSEPVSAPVIGSAASQGGQVGTAFSYQIAASNNPTSFGASGLPAGLSVDSATGLISGTPTDDGDSTATINATNTGGTGNATLTISILPAAPAITSNASASGQVGTAFSYQIAASNNPSSFGSSGLPAGLSVNATTGLISGTPTTAGNSTATINASNSGGTGNATLTISMLPAAPAITSDTSASVQVG